MILILEDGKYTFHLDEKTARLTCLRYGQAWRDDWVGDKAIHALVYRTCELEKQVFNLRLQLEHARSLI